MKQIVFILSIVFVLVGCKTTQLTPETLAVKQAIEMSVEAKDFAMTFDQISPLRGRNIILNSNYTLEVRNDSVFADLPYYGQVTYVRPGVDGGIKFQEPYQNYVWKSTSKNDKYEITMDIRQPDYQYRLFLTIWDNGKVTLSITSPQRDSITYYGEIKN